ncbi:CinA family protein [Microbulbifer bruguierae]|uniref:CinA family protein n=1 Tax=Microbulbifer bruguierae TaxID=3029061 RepID=A0ABY8NDT3_9GAMM|nr:CinA family protein [Microbulbifer bruguierae]WGL16610.1 CinA family protein [Microbulbifer bruguierae]
MAVDLNIQHQAEELGAHLQALRWRVTTAESCTGGAVAAAVTSVSGASAWFDGAIIAYANRIKRGLLGVDPEDLEVFGAVSEPVVRQMAVGVLNRLDANLAVAVSGIAGPDGGSDDKPVGTVWIAWAHGQGQEPVAVEARCMHFNGSRAEVQAQTVAEALTGLLAIAREHRKR